MSEKLRELLKKICKEEREIENVEREIENISLKEEKEKGYLACIKGFINFLKEKESNYLKFSIFYKIFNEKENNKYKIYVEIENFDEEWIIGYKQALKDLINFKKDNQ